VETDAATAAEFARLAAIEAAQGHAAAAAELYLRALNRDYNQIEWRLARAQALIDQGQNAQAFREAKICLTINPNDERARKLVGDLSLKVKE
jgi:tetratricopeptide (TPR) repeat protein